MCHLYLINLSSNLPNFENSGVFQLVLFPLPPIVKTRLKGFDFDFLNTYSRVMRRLLSMFVIKTMNVRVVLVVLFNSAEQSEPGIRYFNQNFSMLENIGKISIRGRSDVKIVGSSKTASKLWRGSILEIAKVGAISTKQKVTVL